ncbi:MAG: PilW family protein [Gammaproteobacteria bacterium]|nr:PilW family protein [Gammaproteobacteria bacterium]
MKKQKGYTLIEYMVAIVIGLILLSGFSYVFLGMKQSFNTQSGLSEVQENGRFAMYFLTNELQNAGYVAVNNPSQVVDNVIPHLISGAGNTSDSGDIKVSDEVEISYKDENGVDCLGDAPAADGIINNRFFVEDGQLKCEGINGNPQPLIGGVEALHFIYGVDTDSDTDGVPNKFVKASELALDEYSRISAIKVFLLLASTDNVSKSDIDQEFTIARENGTFDASDRKIRKLFATTVSLPNQPDF